MPYTKLRSERKRRGWTLAYLAGLLNVHVSTVHLWEQGKHAPYRRTSDVLEAIFGMPIDALLEPENTNGRTPQDATAMTSRPAKVGVDRV